MIIDPQGRLVSLGLHGIANANSIQPSSFPRDAAVSNQHRAETVKRRKMHTLTEAFLDPFTTTQEGELASLMLVAKQPLIARPTTRTKRI